MTANSAVLGGVLYADEATFGDFAVTTFDEALRHIGPIDLTGLTQEKQDTAPVLQLQNEGSQHTRMVQGGSFKISQHLTGHGSSVALGSVLANQLETFLGRVIGNLNVANEGTTGVVAASTVTVPVVADGSAIADDSIIRIGALGDGDGEGQFFAVASEAANAVTLLTDMPGIIADGAEVFAPAFVHPNEGPNSSILTSMRFELLTGNAHVRCWGCFPSSVEFSGLSPGELPLVTVTMQVSKWLPVNSTFPHAVSVDSFSPAPVAAGSLFLNTFGTTTRQTFAVREFNFGLDFQTVPLLGHGSGDGHVNIIGAKRIKCMATCDFVLEAEATGTYTHADRWNTSEVGISAEHLLYSFSVGTDGQAGAIYLRKCRMVGERPLQQDVDGLNRQRLFYMAEADTAGSDDIGRSNFLLASA